MPKSKTNKKQQLFIDKLIIAVAIVEPICTLPQSIAVFRNHDAGGISILTWIGFDILTLIWLWYAIVKKEKVVFLYQILYLVFDTLVIIGAVLYGGQWI